jgi:hypothetical protein
LRCPEGMRWRRSRGRLRCREGLRRRGRGRLWGPESLRWRRSRG